MTQAHAQETLDSRLFHLKMWSKSFSLVEEYRRWSLIIVNQTYTPKMKVTNCIWFFSIMNLITPGGSINFLFFRLSLILHSRVFRRSLWVKMEVTSINGKLHVLTVENRLFGGTTHGDTIKPTIVTSVPRKYANHGPIATADLLASSLLCTWPTRDLYHFISIHTTSVKK